MGVHTVLNQGRDILVIWRVLDMFVEVKHEILELSPADGAILAQCKLQVLLNLNVFDILHRFQQLVGVGTGNFVSFPQNFQVLDPWSNIDMLRVGEGRIRGRFSR